MWRSVALLKESHRSNGEPAFETLAQPGRPDDGPHAFRACCCVNVASESFESAQVVRMIQPLLVLSCTPKEGVVREGAKVEGGSGLGPGMCDGEADEEAAFRSIADGRSCDPPTDRHAATCHTPYTIPYRDTDSCHICYVQESRRPHPCLSDKEKAPLVLGLDAPE